MIMMYVYLVVLPLGYRWTEGIGYENWKKMFNEHWIKPLQIDEPQNRQKFINLETNFAYW